MSEVIWEGSKDLQQFLVPIDDLILLPGNPRVGDIPALMKSLQRFGQRKELTIDQENVVLTGNHTAQAAKRLGWTHIACMDQSDLERSEQRAWALADNRLADLGTYDEEAHLAMLEEAAASTHGLEGLGYTSEDLSEMYAQEEARELRTRDVQPSDERAKSVDLYYSAGNMPFHSGDPETTFLQNTVQVMCCLAVRSGWGYGTRSSDLACGACGIYAMHRPGFIDNHYENYDHKRHVAVVKHWEPKYATVRDVMSERQCEDSGIPYYAPEQIFEWADELSEYAENVIVIPKTVKSIDKVPEQYVLGYSVPTSYGGTPLPIEAFKGRRVHLLGGSPSKQIRYWQAMPDDVVSMDNNYILLTSKFGSVWTHDGSMVSLSDYGIGEINNPLYVALAISLGSIAAWFKRDPEEFEMEEISDGMR